MTLIEFLLARLTEDELSVTSGDCRCGEVKQPDCPDRVLAEVEAKRRLIGWARRWPLRPSMPSDEDVILGLLALPYAGHDAYREEWRP